MKNEGKMSFSIGRKKLRVLLLTSVAAAAALPSFAQDDEAEAGVRDTIVVTGSRIARDANLDAPTAVTTIGEDALNISGETTLSAVLRQIPSFGVSGFTSANTNFSLQSGGINSLELRNLFEDRTLVLQNGRRIVAGIPGTQIVDINLIPIDLIDRVEVVTGGASSIYGSDALAGVVNVVLKDDFEGVKFTSQYGQNIRHADNQEYSFRLTLGGNFGEDRGNAVISAEYVNNKGIQAAGRPNTQVDDFALCRFTGDPNDCMESVEPFFSSFPPQGRFIIEDAVAGTATSYNPDGSLFNTNSGDFARGPGLGDGFNRQAFRTIAVPIERYAFQGLASYDLHEGASHTVEAFLEGGYASTFTRTAFEPVPLESDDIFAQGDSVGVDINNPFVPQAIRDLAIAAGDDSIGFKRRTLELGPRGNEATRETIRIVTGLRGTAWDDYNWEAHINYGRTTRQQETLASVNVLAFREALNAEIDPVTGEPRCADAIARSLGCVPINIFGFDAVSPEAADYVGHVGIINARIEQTVAGLTFAGPVPGFQLPAGEVQFASGLEWRREFSDNQPDGLQQVGLTSGNAIPGNRGQFEVWEGFMEVEVPIVRDKPLFEDLRVGAAYRYSDYSTVGDTHAYSVNANYSPTSDLRFRFQYARAVRAPNIGELFNAGTENFAPVSDPCNNLNAQTDQMIVTTCLQDPAVLVRFNATGDFVLTQDELQGIGGFSSVGNLNLSPEIGKSINAGFVYDGEIGGWSDLTFSVDYFNIDIENFITPPGRQFTLDQCYGSGDFAGNEFCGFIVRDMQGLPSTQAEIDEVNTGQVNAGFFQTSGIDFAVINRFDLAGVGFMNSVSNAIPALEDPGSLALRVNYTYLLKYESEIFGAFEDDRGELSLNKHEILAGIVYDNGPLTFSWDTQWISNVRLSDDPPGNIFDFELGSFARHDMQVRWAVKDGAADLFFGINNVLDKQPPNILSGVPGNATGSDTSTEDYDVIGRSFYGGVTLRF